MKHIKKILSAALLCALVFSGCTVRAEATFKGKTESEWENSFKTTATTTLEKTGTPPDALNGFRGLSGLSKRRGGSGADG